MHGVPAYVGGAGASLPSASESEELDALDESDRLPSLVSCSPFGVAPGEGRVSSTRGESTRGDPGLARIAAGGGGAAAGGFFFPKIPMSPRPDTAPGGTKTFGREHSAGTLASWQDRGSSHHEFGRIKPNLESASRPPEPHIRGRADRATLSRRPSREAHRSRDRAGRVAPVSGVARSTNMVLNLISDFVQEAMPKRREDVAPFLQRVAVWFTVTKAVQVTKRVVIDDIIATRIVGGLVAAKRRIKTRRRRDAKLKELRSQLKRGHNSLRGGGAHDATPGAGASLGASPMTRRARELGVADRHANAEDIENDPRWLSGEYDDGQKTAAREEEVAAAALDEVAMALAMEGSNGESRRLAGMAVKVAALSPPRRSFGSAGSFSFARSPRSPPSAGPAYLGSGRRRRSMHPDDYAEDALAMANRALTMGDDEDGGFTDDEEAEQLAHVRAAAKRSSELARSVTESLSPEKRRESPYGSWRGGSHHSGAAAYARTPPMRNTNARSYDFDSPRGTPGPRHRREPVSPSPAASPAESTPTRGSTPAQLSRPQSRSRSRNTMGGDDDDGTGSESGFESAVNSPAGSRSSSRGPGHSRLSSSSTDVFDGVGRSSDARSPDTPATDWPRGRAGASDATPTASGRVVENGPENSPDADEDSGFETGASEREGLTHRPARRRLRIDELEADEGEVEADTHGTDDQGAGTLDGDPWRPSGLPATLRLEVLSGIAWGSSFSAPPGVESATIGRLPDNDLQLPNGEVSSFHAEARWFWFDSEVAEEGGDVGEWRIADLGSTNGTFLNAEALRPRRWFPLRDGDRVRLGERTDSPTVHVGVTPTSHGAVSGGEPPIALRSASRSSPGKPPRMEDRVLAECPLRGHSQVALFAVFDGHGGHEAAVRAKQSLPASVARLLGGRTPGARGCERILAEAFAECDAAMSCEYEGCAATVMLAWRDPSTGSLYVQTANAGDCHVAFGRAKNPGGSGRGAKFLTKEHRVTSPEERERLRARHGIKLPRGARRLHGLALTRTLGDSFLKRERVGIIATPDVSPPVEVSTGDGWDVAVLATDGLWDVCSAEHAMGVAGKASAGEDQGKDGAGRRRIGVNPAAAAETLVAHARRRKSKDDTAVLAVRLEL